MKKLILLVVAIAAITSLNAQVLKRLGERAKNKMEQKAGDKVDKGVDDATDGKKKEKKKVKKLPALNRIKSLVMRPPLPQTKK